MPRPDVQQQVSVLAHGIDKQLDQFDGADLRFTRKRDSLYVFMLARPKGAMLVIPNTKEVETAQVSQLGRRGDLKWAQKDGALQVSVPVPNEAMPAS